MHKNEFDALVATAAEAAQTYYDGAGAQLMTDAEYDAVVERIEAAAAEHGWDAGGLVDRVAAGASAGGDVTHPVPMLSLSKVKTLEAVGEFVAGNAANVVVEPKLDGLAVRAEYAEGRLVLVATRGDGATGEDVTARASGIAGLPDRVAHAGKFEVRGEVYMTDADFDAANANRIASGRPGFANPRNATAGSLRREDSDYHSPMTFAAYDASGDGFDHGSHVARVEAAAAAGFGTALGLLAAHDIPTVPTMDGEAVLERVEMLAAARASLGFPIDGAVVKADSFADRERLGAASRHPRWATSFKYPADTVVTTVTGVETSIGRTGRLGIRIVVEPTSVGGTTVTYAAGHNVAWMRAEGIGVGSKVSLYRAGDVIPRAVALPAEQQPEGVTAWEPPAGCPQCDGEWDTSSLLWRCTNPDCSITGWIAYACSRDLLDVEGASDAFVTAVVDTGLVSDPGDLFELTAEQIADLPLGTTATGNVRRLGSANAAKIHAGIEKAKTASLDRIVNSLNIRRTGRTISRRLAAHFHTMQALQAATVDGLAEVDGVGAEKAASIHAGLVSRAALIARYAALGVNMGSPASEETSGGQALAGEKVVVTGSMAGEPRLAPYNRNDMNALIETHGGKSSGSVSGSTTLLVCGEPGSSKYQKAVSLGVPILSPTEFADRLGL